jgi:hypothetical protein
MEKTKPRGNPQLQVRVPRLLHRKIRGLARLYKAPVAVFHRDLLETLVDVSKAQSFHLRLQRAMIAHQQKELMLTAREGFTAPSKK